MRIQLHVHREARTPEHEGDGDEDRRRERRSDVAELDPAEDAAHEERDQRAGEHQPAGRRDDPGDGCREAEETAECLAGETNGVPDAAEEGSPEPPQGDDGLRGCLRNRVEALRRGDGARHAARYAGGSTSTSTRLTMSSAVTPPKSDSGSTMMRCASTGTASSRTSSGVA